MTEGLKRYIVKFAEYEGVEVKATSAAKAKARLWRTFDDAYPQTVDFFQFVNRCCVMRLGQTAALAEHDAARDDKARGR